MSRMTLFSSPYLLGFEAIERTLERLAKSAGDSYPPYNIESRDEGLYRITLAVAGFGESELAVTVENGNELFIRGKQTDEAARDYLHRGIAARQFQRVFLLADGMDVTDATLNHGLLSVDLKRVSPGNTVRRIAISPGGSMATAPQGANTKVVS